MKHIFYSLVLILLFFSMSSCWKDDILEDGKGGDDVSTSLSLIQDNTPHTFNYSELPTLADKPIKVHYLLPSAGDVSRMPILFIFPGESRDADIHLEYFSSWAKKNRVMIFAFEFPVAYYPSTTEYILGGINKSQSNVGILAKASWNFNYVEAIFDAVKLLTKSIQTSYDMWGHSAGGQFVHRFCTFMETTHVNRAVAANSGWYTLPDAKESFPYGYKEITDVKWNKQLPRLLARNFYVQLGGNDTSTSGLNNKEGSVTQGSNRLERGKFYYTTSQSIAKNSGVYFNWKLSIVPGVGHEPEKMAKAAMEIFTY